MLENIGDFIINMLLAIGEFMDTGINFYISCIIIFSMIIGNLLLFLKRR